MDVTILVAYHKESWLPQDSVYLPACTSRLAASPDGLHGGAPAVPSSGIACGSHPAFCELQALQWARRHLDASHVGLCHYRRYFGKAAGNSLLARQDLASRRRRIFARSDYERLLTRFDLVLPRRRRYVIETVASHYAHAHHPEELELVRDVLLSLQPASLPAFREVMERRWLYLYNMFAMPKSLFEEYADWLFPVLADFEERLQPWRYPTPYERRAPAFMAERLFNVWLAQRRLRAIECPVVLLDRENWPRKAFSFLWRKYVKPGRNS
ncbi:MAG: DUF4422 domain-containing protein [Desulfovibrio sp.]|nr:DUF4422 domain-containing protein [Desulfovibrio sp.]